MTVQGVNAFLVHTARRSGCLRHHLEHIQLFSCLSLGAATVGGTQTHWGLWMTVNCTSFTFMEKFTDGREFPRNTVKNARTRGGYLIIYGCYKGRLRRGAQGVLSAQRALEGAVSTSAPKTRAHLTTLPHKRIL